MLLLLLLIGSPPDPAPSPRLVVYVASATTDVVSRVHFGPEGAGVDRVVPVDPRPGELDGPAELALSPDRRFWYVSVSRGEPNGSLWKFTVTEDSLVGVAGLSHDPGTIGLSPDGEFAWVTNGNRFGDRVPSAVSLVYAPIMQEVARIPACLMPHGLQVAPDGGRVWMTCMGDDKVVEIDPSRRAITRVASVRPGAEQVTVTASAMDSGEPDLAHGPRAAGPNPGATGAGCAPYALQSAADGTRLYVSCRQHAEVLELNAVTLAVSRRIPTGKSPSALALSPSGELLLAVLAGPQALGLIDPSQGREVARLRTSHAAPGGVQVTPDGRFAVVACAGTGTAPGAVDLFDLTTRTLLSTVEVGAGAMGIRILDYQP